MVSEGQDLLHNKLSVSPTYMIHSTATRPPADKRYAMLTHKSKITLQKGVLVPANNDTRLVSP